MEIHVFMVKNEYLGSLYKYWFRGDVVIKIIRSEVGGPSPLYFKY